MNQTIYPIGIQNFEKIRKDGYLVIAVSIRRKLSPANFCNPSLMIFIPYKNSAKEPISRRKSKKE